MGVHYFQDALRLQDCLVPSGKIEGSEYPARWGAMQAANQAVSPLTGFAFQASFVQERLQVTNKPEPKYAASINMRHDGC